MLLKYLKRRNRKTDSQMADALCLTTNHYRKLEKEGWSCKPSKDPEEPYILYYDPKAILYESYKPLKRWPKIDKKPKEVIKLKRMERPREKLIQKMNQYGFTFQYLAEETSMHIESLYKIISKGTRFSYVLFYKLWVLFGGDLEESDCLFEGEEFIKEIGFAKYLLKEGYIEDNGWRDLFVKKNNVKNKKKVDKVYWQQMWG